MENVDRVRASLPAAANDAQLNLASVLGQGALDEGARWAVAIACAYAVGDARLTRALLADAAGKISDGALEDARAAAIVMAQNNVLYRFRHQIEKEGYAHRPARLRMNRINQLRSDRATFELMCLAVSAIEGCASCVRAHERSVLAAGMTEEQVFDAVRIASTVRATAVALSIGETT